MPSVLEIHSGLVLKGNLSMLKDVVLTGKFEGELQTQGCLTVASGGTVTGSIDAGALVLEPGNKVQACVKVSTPPKNASRLGQVGTISGWRQGIKKLKEMAFGRT
jgi:hypothetical protein